MLQNIRAFFDELGYLEVTTPVLMRSTNPDPNLQSIAVTGDEELFLQTSPEFAMKRLLAAGYGSIFQIAPAFRNDEQGRSHHREFSMLEWYVEGFDYRQLMQQVETLIRHLADDAVTVSSCSYCELFARHLQIDIDSIGLLELQQLCRDRADYHAAQGLDRQQCLDLLLAVVIEPLMQGFLLVFDYPATQSSLARSCAHRPGYVERFELFHDGMEIANGFSELTDACEQRQRFEKDRQQRESLGLPVYPLDEVFLAALEHGLPDCAGVAVGIERLLMALLGLQQIDNVLLFRD